MKRPLAWICIALVLVLAAVYRIGDGKDASLPAAALDTLLESADSAGRVTLLGTVAGCNAVSEGIRLSMDHISIHGTDKSEILECFQKAP